MKNVLFAKPLRGTSQVYIVHILPRVALVIVAFGSFIMVLFTGFISDEVLRNGIALAIGQFYLALVVVFVVTQYQKFYKETPFETLSIQKITSLKGKLPYRFGQFATLGSLLTLAAVICDSRGDIPTVVIIILLTASLAAWTKVGLVTYLGIASNVLLNGKSKV